MCLWLPILDLLWVVPHDFSRELTGLSTSNPVCVYYEPWGWVSGTLISTVEYQSKILKGGLLELPEVLQLCCHFRFIITFHFYVPLF